MDTYYVRTFLYSRHNQIGLAESHAYLISLTGLPLTYVEAPP
jgi:hypothetical protein